MNCISQTRPEEEKYADACSEGLKRIGVSWIVACAALPKRKGCSSRESLLNIVFLSFFFFQWKPKVAVIGRYVMRHEWYCVEIFPITAENDMAAGICKSAPGKPISPKENRRGLMFPAAVRVLLLRLLEVDVDGGVGIGLPAFQSLREHGRVDVPRFRCSPLGFGARVVGVVVVRRHRPAGRLDTCPVLFKNY